MDFDARLKAYEERYRHEIDTREKIEARIKTPFSMFLVVFGLIAYLFKETILVGKFEYNWTFWASYILAVSLFIASLGFFIRAIYGYHYLLMPTPVILEKYHEKTRNEYAEVNPSKAKSWTNEAFKQYLFDSYVKYTTQNTKNNDSKSLNISRCLGTLISSFIIVSSSYLPFYSGVLEHKENENVQQTTTTATTTTERCEGPAAKQTATATSSTESQVK
jgi:hypothetical protein